MAITYAEVQEKKNNNQWFSDNEATELFSLGTDLLTAATQAYKGGIDPNDHEGIGLLQKYISEQYSSAINEIADFENENDYNYYIQVLGNLNEMLHKRSADSGKSFYEILMDQLKFNSLEERKKKFDIPLSKLNNMLDLGLNLTDLELEYNQKHNIVDPDLENREINDVIDLGAGNPVNMMAPPFEMAPPIGGVAAPGVGAPQVGQEAPGVGAPQVGQDMDAPPILGVGNNVNNAAANINAAEPDNQQVHFSEAARRAYCSEFYLDEYLIGVDGLANDLETIKKDLKEKGQTNQNANFGKQEKEGGKKYRAMTEALQKAIDSLKSRDMAPSQVRKSLSDLYKASLDYYNDHCGLLWKPRKGTKGRERLDISDKLTEILPGMINLHDTLRNGVCYTKSEDGIIHGNKPINDVITDLQNEATVFNFANNRDEIRRETDIKRSKYSYDQIKTRSNNQIELRNKIKKMSKTFAKNYDITLGVDHYLNIKKGMSITDKARYIIFKKYMDKAYRPSATNDDIKKVADEFNPENVKKEYEALAKNPLFIDCMKKNPQTAFSKWDNIEKNTDKVIKGYQEELDRIIGNRRETLTAKYLYIWHKENGIDYSTENEKFQKLGRVLALQIITSPQGRNLGRAISIEGANEFDAFAENISKYIKDRDILNKYNGHYTMDKIKSCLMDPQLSGVLIKDYTAKKQAANRNRGNVVQREANNQRVIH
ncbi:hypothetical protein SAMN06297422_11957 [Lachnospiraceae bacterium]|nr:hypothetical protein SAMN06297422_11957 [Lachnospiraceae bacterium]